PPAAGEARCCLCGGEGERGCRRQWGGERQWRTQQHQQRLWANVSGSHSTVHGCGASSCAHVQP
ncbi:unnamed protein product, partial [Closterium sp. NIES-53]